MVGMEASLPPGVRTEVRLPAFPAATRSLQQTGTHGTVELLLGFPS